MAIHENLTNARPQTAAAGNRLDQSEGTGQGGTPGGAAIRKCTLGAQSVGTSERGIQKRGRTHLTGRNTEASELLYFRLFKSQLAVIEQTLETASLMLGSDKSRGYCLEMICADFLAGANLQEGNPDTLVLAVRRLVEMLPAGQREQVLQGADAVP